MESFIFLLNNCTQLCEACLQYQNFTQLVNTQKHFFPDVVPNDENLKSILQKSHSSLYPNTSFEIAKSQLFLSSPLRYAVERVTPLTLGQKTSIHDVLNIILKV